MRDRIFAALSCLLGRPTMYRIDLESVRYFKQFNSYACEWRERKPDDRVYSIEANKAVVP